MVINRRNFLHMGTALGTNIAMLASGVRLAGAAADAYPPTADGMTYEVMHSAKEWRSMLTEAQFDVLREEATEKPFSSPLNAEEREGTYYCASCDLPVYKSETKFKSGTGWPSFYDNVDDAVRIKDDSSFFSTRTEVHCRRCGGHFGHIFEDGPKPTGLRHCLNGLALTFKAGA